MPKTHKNYNEFIFSKKKIVVFLIKFFLQLVLKYYEYGNHNIGIFSLQFSSINFEFSI